VRELVALVTRGYVRQWEEVGRRPRGLIQLNPETTSVSSTGRLAFRLREWWIPTDADPRLTGCQYVLSESRTDQEILAFHRHAGRFQSGHYHLGPAAGSRSALFDRTHVPAPGVTLELFVEMLITEFGVRPLRSDWRGVLEAPAT
jgi:hypothetical protein